MKKLYQIFEEIVLYVVILFIKTLIFVLEFITKIVRMISGKKHE